MRNNNTIVESNLNFLSFGLLTVSVSWMVFHLGYQSADYKFMKELLVNVDVVPCYFVGLVVQFNPNDNKVRSIYCS